MAPIGVITSSLALDKTRFQGQEDPVTGTITLTYQPKNNAHDELFGPLQLRIVLEGQMKLHVAENRTSHAYIFFNETRVVVSKTQDVFSGPFRVSRTQPVPIPFRMLFPKTVDGKVGLSAGGVTPDKLPPSFATRFQAEAPLKYGKHQGAADIEYSLRAEAELPGIDAKIVHGMPVVVKYTPPNSLVIPANNENKMISQKLQVQTHQLLPDEERPSNLLHKTKAVLNNVPKPVLAFTATCINVPETIVVGQPIQFELRAQIDISATTATTSPAISLSDSKMDIIAYTALYATNQKGANSAQIKGEDTIHSCKMTTQEPTGPFEKSNDNTKTVTFPPVPLTTPSSFSVIKLSRSYKAIFEFRFIVAGEKATVMKRQIAIRILPPSSTVSPPSYLTSTSNVSAAGPSRQPRMSVESEHLPHYEDAVRS